MIELIKIKNHSLISDCEIHLKDGFNVITGETGAGKSLFINAMSAILNGNKSDQSLIGKNSNELTITIEINPKNLPLLLNYLKENEKENESFIVKKIISKEKVRSYINDELVSQTTVKNLIKDIVSICSQHDGQKISNKSFQRNFLDIYSNTSKELIQVEFLFLQKQKLIKEKEDLLKNNSNRDQDIEFAQFQLKEIKELSISEKDENLEERISEINNLKEINEKISELNPLISGESSVPSLLMEIEFILEKINKLGKKNDLSKFIELKREIISELKAMDLETDLDDNFDDLIERVEKISKVKKRYGSIQGVLEKEKELENKIEKLENLDETILKIEKQIEKINKEASPFLNKLSEKRKQGSLSLSKKISSDLQELNMKGSVFSIQINPKEDFDQFGKDEILFLIKPHAGQNPEPIEKIASGGELSRVILAIQNNISDGGCFLFDEIDAGIGGNTGFKIGQKLKEMSKNSQVICITHLHQVAIYSNNHLKIEKVQSKNKTETQITPLNKETQEVEIARMIGNDLPNKDKALDLARELLKNAQKNNT